MIGSIVSKPIEQAVSEKDIEGTHVSFRTTCESIKFMYHECLMFIGRGLDFKVGGH